MMTAAARRSRWWVAAAVAATAVVASLSGCASSGDSGKVTLRFQVEQGDPNLAIAQAWIKGFEKTHQNVTIKPELTSQEAVASTNATVLSGGNPPDIGLIATGTPQYEKLVQSGALADLAPVWKGAQLDTRYPKALNDLLSYGGKHYSIGVSTGFYNVVYYNKDLFKRAGITAPDDHRIASVDDLYSMVSKLKAIGVEGLGIGGKANAPASWMVSALLPTAVSGNAINNYLSSYLPANKVTAKYTDPGFVKVLETLQEFGKKGVYQSGFLGMDNDQTDALFVQGQVGMELEGYWVAQGFHKSNPNLDFDWLLLPPVGGGADETQLTSFFATGISVPAKGKHVALAQEFLQYMVSDQGQVDAILKAGSQIPAVTTVPESAYADLDPAVKEMVADARDHGVQSGWSTTVPGEIGQGFIDPLLQSMYAGQTTPQEVAQKVQTALEQARAKG
jgi:raffinose/stachyose/melibiose transport system substrate-binding protein